MRVLVILKKVVRLLFLSGIVLCCITGCAAEKQDELKSLSLENLEESGNEDGTVEIQSEEVTENDTDNGSIFVHVCGAVEVPGVYELDSGARVYEALACAGGLRDDAAKDFMNQAQILSDGEQIFIPTQEEAEQNDLTTEVEGAKTGITEDGRVDINYATKEELMTLSGIGESRAESILAYRESNGPFQTVEDLMNVDGIKEGIFQKIKDSITVTTGS